MVSPRNPALSFCGVRIACSVEKKAALAAYLGERLKERPTWTKAAATKVIHEAKVLDWGVLTHGGRRRGLNFKVQTSKTEAIVKPEHRHYRYRTKKAPPASKAAAIADVAICTDVVSTDAVAIGTDAVATDAVADPDAVATDAVVTDAVADLDAVATDAVALGADAVATDAVAVGADAVAFGTDGGEAPTTPPPRPRQQTTTTSQHTFLELQKEGFGFLVERRLGHGVYGQVFQATHDSGLQVAIKHMDCKPGGQLTSLQKREVASLKKLNGHPHISRLYQVNITTFGVDLVLELAHRNLKECIREGPLLPDQIHRYTRDLFSGLSYAHSANIIHRDIKPDNLLLHDLRNALQIADFGMARESAIGDQQCLTKIAYTLWYRPPEILLCSTSYDFASDVWAAGCVCIEMCERKPAFPGKAELQTLQLQFKTFGTPTPAEWPGFAKLPHAHVVRGYPRRPWPEWGGCAGSEYIFLLKGILTLVPIHRITSREAFTISSKLFDSSQQKILAAQTEAL